MPLLTLALTCLVTQNIRHKLAAVIFLHHTSLFYLIESYGLFTFSSKVGRWYDKVSGWEGKNNDKFCYGLLLSTSISTAIKNVNWPSPKAIYQNISRVALRWNLWQQILQLFPQNGNNFLCVRQWMLFTTFAATADALEWRNFIVILLISFSFIASEVFFI